MAFDLLDLIGSIVVVLGLAAAISRRRKGF